MGPQLNRCGNKRVACSRRATFTGFNGAATKPLRKLGGGAWRAAERSGFNGAATKPLRKPLSERSDFAADRTLQWGRN